MWNLNSPAPSCSPGGDTSNATVSGVTWTWTGAVSGTVAATAAESARPSAVQMAFDAVQSVVVGSVMLTSPLPLGVTVTVHSRFSPCVTRDMPVIDPFAI